MKGLKPLNEDFVFILEKQSSVLESKKNSNDEYLLEGIAAVFGKENNNHRIYEENEYLPHLDYLHDKIKQQRLLGELDHPEKFDISLKNISHLVTDLNYNKGERTLKIKVKLLDTPAGRIAKSLVDSGIPLSISSRAAGSVGSDKKVQIKKIFTYDLVADPGFKNAQLERVYESCGYSNTEYSKIKNNSIVNHLECLNESLGLKNQDSMMIYRVDNNEEFEKLLNKKEKTTSLMERNNEFVTSEELDQYSVFLKKEMDSMKSEMSRLRNNPVSESNIGDSDFRISKLEKYAEYLAESLEGTIKYNEYLAENLDKSISYSKYLAENVDKNISYSKYLAENMDQNISYTEYLAENLDKSISYSNYLGENVDKNISYTEYVAESVDKNIDRNNVAYQLLFGTRPDILVEIGHDTLVIISNFRDSSVQLEGEAYEQSLKYWVEKFTPSEKHKAIKLVLLSTDKKPSDDLIKLTELSGGSYRKLTVGVNGSYE